jgi:hypothetical protein
MTRHYNVRMSHRLTDGSAVTMLGMAKKKSQGRARQRGDTVPFTLELDPELDRALEACRDRDMRTKKAIVTIALQEYLAGQGLWPANK